MTTLRLTLATVLACALALGSANAKKPSAKKAAQGAKKATSAARPSVPFKGTARVTARVLNLRAAPTASSRDIGDIRRNTKLTLVARTQKRFAEDSSGAAYWYQTKANGRTGWVWGGYLQVTRTKPPRPPSQTNGRPTQWITGVGYSMLNGLNLRAGPSTKARDLGDVKYGQRLKIHARTVERYVADHRGKYRWYEVSFGGKRGWVYGAYVRFHSPPPSGGGSGGGNVAGYPGYSAAGGQSLAKAAYRRGTTRPTVGYCLKGVEEALQASIFHGFRYWKRSAHDFGVYVESRHAELARRGLRVVNNPPSRSSTFPKGTVMVFSRGRCGFNAQWGHIEVVVDHDTACSDHCRRRNDEWCGPTTILYPTRK